MLRDECGACGGPDLRVFLEKLVGIAGVVPNIPDVLVTHRYTPDSTYN